MISDIGGWGKGFWEEWVVEVIIIEILIENDSNIKE